jgi:predicted transcriptional regulator
MTDESTSSDIALPLTAEIVAAYVAKNPLPRSALPDLIAATHASLKTLTPGAQPVEPPLTPAVPVKKSVTPDYIVSLEDGRKFKSMKRYLGLLGMTPDDYRRKWSLPADYPMVAPNYAARRSALAKSIGLGRKPGAVKAGAKPAKKRPAKA